MVYRRYLLAEYESLYVWWPGKTMKIHMIEIFDILLYIVLKTTAFPEICFHRVYVSSILKCGSPPK